MGQDGDDHREGFQAIQALIPIRPLRVAEHQVLEETPTRRRHRRRLTAGGGLRQQRQCVGPERGRKGTEFSEQL